MRYRVLVVEDEPALQETLKAYLEPTYKVTAVSTAADATQVLEKINFKVILVDLGLPDTNGINLIRQIVLNHKKIAVIALTGDRSEKSVKDSIDAGVDNYIVKPAEQAVLHNRIKKAIMKRGLGT